MAEIEQLEQELSDLDERWNVARQDTVRALGPYGRPVREGLEDVWERMSGNERLSIIDAEFEEAEESLREAIRREEELETELEDIAERTQILQELRDYALALRLTVNRRGGDYAPSFYLDIDNPENLEEILTIRISNHAQPAGGGFYIDSYGYEDRHGEADISIDPTTDATMEDAKQLIDQVAEGTFEP